MEIQSLKVLVTDADLAALLKEAMSNHDSIEGLEARLTPEGALLRGEYPTGFGLKVPFETVWQLVPAGPVLQVQLASVKVAGVPAGLLRGALIRMVRDAVEGQPGLSVQDEAVVIDVAAAARRYGVAVRVAFTAVRMSFGAMVVEAGG